VNCLLASHLSLFRLSPFISLGTICIKTCKSIFQNLRNVNTNAELHINSQKRQCQTEYSIVHALVHAV
jgi:hypothetical protein